MPAPPRHKRGIQLQFSESRLLMMAGDAMIVVVSVLTSLRIWAIFARATFDLDFVLPQLYWFFVLTFIWYVLAAANDFYNLRMASQIRTSLPRLIQITLQLLIVYLLIFFVSSRAALPRLFILYSPVISFVLLPVLRSRPLFPIG